MSMSMSMPMLTVIPTGEERASLVQTKKQELSAIYRFRKTQILNLPCLTTHSKLKLYDSQGSQRISTSISQKNMEQRRPGEQHGLSKQGKLFIWLRLAVE